MRVKLQHDKSAENFAKQLLDIANGKMAIDESTKCITLPTNFCNITSFRDELIQNEIPGETTTYKCIDTVMNQDEVISYPIEFLNSLYLSSMPPLFFPRPGQSQLASQLKRTSN
jgi:hypothetical protein